MSRQRPASVAPPLSTTTATAPSQRAQYTTPTSSAQAATTMNAPDSSGNGAMLHLHLDASDMSDLDDDDLSQDQDPMPLPIPAPPPGVQFMADLKFEATLAATARAVHAAKRIVVIAGAGISVSAGIPDFRSEDGLYRLVKGNHPGVVAKGQDLFDASLFRDPAATRLFYSFMAGMRDACLEAQPTPTHQFLADLARRGTLMRVYTQNIDGLEHRAGLDQPDHSPPLTGGDGGDDSEFRSPSSQLGSDMDHMALSSSQPSSSPPPPTASLSPSDLPAPLQVPLPPTTGNGRSARRNNNGSRSTLSSTSTSNNSGHPTVVQLHGSLAATRCTLCSHTFPFTAARSEQFGTGEPPGCPACVARAREREVLGKRARACGTLRPDVVLYNESHPEGDAIGAASARDRRRRPDLVIIMGTSLKVHGIKALVRDMATATRSASTTAGGGAPASSQSSGDRPRVIVVNRTSLAGQREWAAHVDAELVADADAVVSRWAPEVARLDAEAAARSAKRRAALAARTAAASRTGPADPMQMVLEGQVVKSAIPATAANAASVIALAAKPVWGRPQDDEDEDEDMDQQPDRRQRVLRFAPPPVSPPVPLHAGVVARSSANNNHPAATRSPPRLGLGLGLSRGSHSASRPQTPTTPRPLGMMRTNSSSGTSSRSSSWSPLSSPPTSLTSPLPPPPPLPASTAAARASRKAHKVIPSTAVVAAGLRVRVRAPSSRRPSSRSVVSATAGAATTSAPPVPLPLPHQHWPAMSSSNGPTLALPLSVGQVRAQPSITLPTFHAAAKPVGGRGGAANGDESGEDDAEATESDDNEDQDDGSSDHAFRGGARPPPVTAYGTHDENAVPPSLAVPAGETGSGVVKHRRRSGLRPRKVPQPPALGQRLLVL
ncbi:hypothetical protein BC828DRAFT_26047 [Blastocladiella britannica]|nr:hypothetical protein BC828DRAFT_26047 [Blastocladiella britannica]